MKSAGLSRPIKGSERYRDRKGKRKARENSGSERDLLKHLGKEKEKTGAKLASCCSTEHFNVHFIYFEPFCSDAILA